ncbi:M56 family metallopeptidase [Tenacibaculum bernardetii]|uniref:M56 family metallopeptidase n=1 Tax=Tenacibaculum bernardetii TaxID=3021375 RepID=UPI0023AECBCB|nr:M56 family metallopeptidase [Tenacibaculum bernardetii]
MISYFIKSAICLTLLLLFYHLVLEREKMHKFNRFYLLGSVLFSFLAPLFIIYTEASPLQIIETMKATTEQPIVFETAEVIETPINYFNYFIYFSIFISTILLIRFIKNVVAIYQKTRENCTIKHQKATLVLVDDEISPHTFWNYIFINKTAYDSQKIEEELFTHELTHATQKHTFDVLLIEVLKIVFWFNPIFYFLKKRIQLNHEFLADTKVISNHKNISEYQHLLLNKTAWNNDYYLASNLNYLLTKKRLLMMTKQSSRTKVLLKKLAVIPVTVGFVFLFAERVEAQETITEVVKNLPKNNYQKKGNLKTTLPNGKAIEVWEELIDKGSNEYQYTRQTFWVKDKNDKDIPSKYSNLSEDGKKKWLLFPPIMYNKKQISNEEFNRIKDSENYVVRINGHVVKNSKLNEFSPKDFASYSSKKISRLAMLSQKQHYNLIDEEGLDLNIHLKGLGTKRHKYRRTKSSKQSIASESVVDDVKLKLENADALKLSIEENQEVLVKKLHNSDVKKYILLNSTYEKLRKKNPHFIQSSEKRQSEIKDLFSELSGMYFKLSSLDKKKVKRPIFPQHPYIRLKKNNKVFYKLKNELTTEDKLLLPPPPPIPNASKEEILKVKKAYNEWKIRTGNIPPPPPKPSTAKIVKKGEVSNILPPPPSKKKTKNNWVVEDEVHIVEDVNTETGDVYKRKDTKEKPTSNESTEFVKLDKKVKKTYFIEGKKTSKKEFYNHLKNIKDYHYGSAYTDKEKTAINLYISKSQDKIIKLMQKGY